MEPPEMKTLLLFPQAFRDSIMKALVEGRNTELHLRPIVYTLYRCSRCGVRVKVEYGGSMIVADCTTCGQGNALFEHQGVR